MLKKIILGIFLFIIICSATIVYIGYRSFNQEAFKNQIVQTLQNLTGRTFVVNGPYNLVWRPMPTMTLENVSLSNIPNASTPDMFTADKIQIQIEWGSLFSTPIRIKNIIVVNPKVVVERISHSVTNVDFPALFAAEDTSTPESLLGERRAQALIDNISIQNGTFRYVNKMWDLDYQIEQLSGDVSFGSLSGPFGFKGKGFTQNIPIEINTTLSKREISKPVDVWLGISFADAEGTLKLVDAKIYPGDTEKYLTGYLTFELKKANVLLEKLNLPPLPQKLGTYTEGSMIIDVSSKLTSLSKFILKVGNPDNLTTANITYSRKNSAKTNQIVLNIPRLDLDIWKDTLYKFLQQKTFFSSPTNFEITISNLSYNSQEATTLHIRGIADAKQIQFSESSVLLPGQTTVQMDGSLDTASDAWTGNVNISLQSQNFPLALSFINLPTTPLLSQLKKFKTAEFSSTLSWSPDLTKISVPALSLDQATGIATYTQAINQPANLSFELNHINLNDYIEQTEKTSYTLSDVQQSIFDFFKTPISNKPFDLKFLLNDVKLKSTTFDNITISAKQADDTLQLDMAAKNKDNSLSFNTQILNFGTENWQLDQNKFDIKIAELSKFLNELSVNEENKIIQNTHSFAAQGNLTGSQNNWTMDFSGQALPYTFQFKGNLLNNNPQNMKLHIQHKSAPHFFVDLWGKNPFSELNGEFVFDSTVTQKDERITFSDAKLQLATETFSGEATYFLNSHEVNVKATTKALNLNTFLSDLSHRFYFNGSSFDDKPFNLEAFQKHKGSLTLHADTLSYQTINLQNADIKLNLKNNTLHLENFFATGKQKNSSLKVKGTLTFQKTPELNLTIKTKDLPIASSQMVFNGRGLSGGTLTSDLKLSTSGNSPLQLVSNLTGSGQLNLNNPNWLGADITSLIALIQQAYENDETSYTFEQKLTDALSRGTTPVQSIGGKFNIQNGLWQIDTGTFNVDNITAPKIAIDWNIPQEALSVQLPFTINQYSNFPAISLSLLKNPQDISYNVDMKDFNKALEDDIKRSKDARLEAKQKALELTLQKELDQTRKEADKVFQSLTENLSRIEQQIEQTPNIQAQQSFKAALVIHQNLATIMENKDSILEQYQYVIAQAQVAQKNLDETQEILYEQQAQDMKDKASALLTEAEKSLSQIAEMYQKKAHIALLADLHENAQKQRDIISRAVDQFDKNLTFEQIKKILEIIQNALSKINKARDYAEEIYSGRQDNTTKGTIKRILP